MLASDTGHSSDLWGTAGEKWTPQSRLPDFSFAGYHAGEAPIPDVAVKASVKNFGAKGDGVADDTAAFKNWSAGVLGEETVNAEWSGGWRLTGEKTNREKVWCDGLAVVAWIGKS
ncbi:MAG: hypothetical protein NTY01_02510 [Verrucomicrobia bacterium]|nr:hypothetical protein [Verrucomicrobiota bacterium]